MMEKGNKNQEVTYVNNKRAAAVLYNDNGTPKFKALYKNGYMDGERTVYDEKGKPVNGAFTFFDKQDMKEREGFCVKGKPEGELKVYLAGALSMTANFEKGKPQGYTYYYDGDKITRSEKYINGVFIEEKIFPKIK